MPTKKRKKDLLHRIKRNIGDKRKKEIQKLVRSLLKDNTTDEDTDRREENTQTPPTHTHEEREQESV